MPHRLFLTNEFTNEVCERTSNRKMVILMGISETFLITIMKSARESKDKHNSRYLWTFSQGFVWNTL